MKLTKKIDIYSCNRCDINSIKDPDRWCPCPRGGCEAKKVGTIILTAEVDKFKVSKTALSEWFKQIKTQVEDDN